MLADSACWRFCVVLWYEITFVSMHMQDHQLTVKLHAGKTMRHCSTYWTVCLTFRTCSIWRIFSTYFEWNNHINLVLLSVYVYWHVHLCRLVNKSIVLPAAGFNLTMYKMRHFCRDESISVFMADSSSSSPNIPQVCFTGIEVENLSANFNLPFNNPIM